ncbi:hypothetical protein KHC28_00470 [Ancylobacter sonchi]|uniref:hypothetical protein n=1 Tax=Ancylobacter sonchi TaxID=1937790 RepID=UPI001BD27B88|nr:hypothetical protein [Ancylobacter sonchi]MBS7532139.1 hypothetical protein [Ancylobacter sonchi]
MGEIVVEVLRAGPQGPEALRSEGVWSPGHYSARALVQHTGAYWLAQRATEEEPSTEAVDWSAFINYSADMDAAIGSYGANRTFTAPTLAAAQAAVLPTSVASIVVQTRDGTTGGFRTRRVPDEGAILAGQFVTGGTYLRQRHENAEDTITPAMFSDVSEMFAFTKAKIAVPKGNYEFNSPIATRDGLTLSCEGAAVFRPTWAPVGSARATPMFSFGAGANVDRLDVRLVAGINTIRTLVRFNGSYQVGLLNLDSVDLNNNRQPGVGDLISGAVIFSGEYGRAGNVFINNFDRGWASIDSTDLVISHIRNIGTIMGGYVSGTRHMHILSGRTTGLANPAIANAFNRGIMSRGANSILFEGCTDSSVSNWYTYDILEHAIRVANAADGTIIPNERLTFNNLRMYRPYGCGFKLDDSDLFLIKDIIINGLYTEDVGRGNWYGTEGFQNWASSSSTSPGSHPDNNNDGNKVACAIRNSERVRVTGFMNRKLLYDHSGYMGFWVERSSNVSASQIDTEYSRFAGVCIQSGGSQACEKIALDNVITRYNLGAGLRWNAGPSSGSAWRAVHTRGLVSQNNTGAGYEVIASADGSSPFQTITCSIEGRVSDNAGGNRSVPDTVNVSSRFREDVRENGIGTVTFSFATPGDVSVSYASQSIIWQRDGNYVNVEIALRATLTFTTASGALQILGLPYPALSAVNKIDLVASNSAFSSWNSRVEIVPSVQEGTTRIELRGYSSNVDSSPITASNVVSGSELLLRLSGTYRI